MASILDKKKKFQDPDAAGIYGATPTGGIPTTKYAKDSGAEIGMPRQADTASPEELDSLASKLKQKPIDQLPDDESDDTTAPVASVDPAPATPVESPVEVAKRGQIAVAKAATEGNPNEPLIPSEAKKYLDSLQGMKNQYAPSAPEHTQRTLSEAIAKANELYQNQANKNEWLEVAQMLGRAGAQFAAAQSGMANGGQYGKNMAALDPGAGIDYNARTERAARDRTQSVNEAKDLAASDRQTTEDQNKIDQFKYGADKDYNHEGLSTVMKARADQVAERGQDRRAAKALQGEDLRDSRSVRAAHLHELDVEQKAAVEEDKARSALVNQLLTSGDMSSKAVKKLQETQPQLAAKAGVDLQGISKQMESQETTLPGWAGGKSSDKETADKRTILDKILGESKSKLAEIKNRRDALLSQPLSGSPAPSTPAPSSPTPPGKIRVKQKATGQAGSINESDFDPAKYERL